MENFCIVTVKKLKKDFITGISCAKFRAPLIQKILSLITTL